MRKLLSVALTAVLVAGVLGADAGAAKPRKRTRVAKGSYDAPATAIGFCSQQDGIGCMTIPSGPKEKYLSAVVKDSHGQPVAISIQADTDGDSISDKTYGNFCGKTAKPIKIDPGASLIFWVSTPATIVGTRCVPGEGTQGTLTVKFSNLP
jgi:hypothetical protein